MHHLPPFVSVRCGCMGVRGASALTVVVAAVVALQGCTNGPQSGTAGSSSRAAVTTTAPALSTAQLSEAVQRSVQERLDQEFPTLHLLVTGVTLVKDEGSHYSGIADVKPGAGVIHPTPITVMYDGENMIWRSDEDAFDWTTSLPSPGA